MKVAHDTFTEAANFDIQESSEGVIYEWRGKSLQGSHQEMWRLLGYLCECWVCVGSASVRDIQVEKKMSAADLMTPEKQGNLCSKIKFSRY